MQTKIKGKLKGRQKSASYYCKQYEADFRDGQKPNYYEPKFITNQAGSCNHELQFVQSHAS